MNLSVTTEMRFIRTADGAVWTQTTYAYPFWRRYLAVFDGVCVLARVRNVASVPPDWKRADGAHVSFIPLPYYLGPWQYLLRAWQIRSIGIDVFDGSTAVIMRLPSQIATSLGSILRRTRQPYAVELVGDPYDVFAPGAVRNPLRPFFRWWFRRQLERQCKGAIAVSFVTEEALQRRYPTAPQAFSTHYSSIELTKDSFVTNARQRQMLTAPIRLLLVGSLAQMYKAPDILIAAVGLCVRAGLDLQLAIVGDGKHRAELEALATAQGLGKRAHFLGQLPAGAAVRAELDRADLFVLPSRTEGLPRAMIEAMARALPCIGSAVGGMPELLSPEDMVQPGDAAALAGKIQEIVNDPERMAAMSARNLTKAREYHDDMLRKRRNMFYQYVKERTEAWRP